MLCGFISSEALSNVAKKFFVQNTLLRWLQVLQSGCFPQARASVEKFSTIHAAKFPKNKKNLFILKSKQITCPWRLQLVSSTDVLIYVDVISNKQSIFSSQIRTPSFPINWPSLISTARSLYTLKGLRSNKPSHKHDSNKYQSKTFVLCDHKSDQTRFATHVNKTYLA